MSSHSNKLPYIAASASAVIFGFSFIFTKGALDSLAVFQLLGFRFLAAALFLTALMAAGYIKVDRKARQPLPVAMGAENET